jgi:NADH:ubiquinone oxidoreductase subunit K
MLNFLLAGSLYGDIIPQLFVLFIILTASAEVVVAFSIILTFYRQTGVIYITPTYFVR